ncbi:hypothetical protein [Parvibaculum sp.]|mgnify:FL=1|jgi:hypothetical protein|uniref:hypothetical protein n=2 Tax=Parvibaculum sp. TaxID=2024848 RepID=UPI0032978C9F
MMRGLIAQDAARGTRGMARALLALLLLLVLSLMEPPLRAAELNGGYDGIGEAAGMALTLSEAERRVVGRLAMPSGVAYTLNGERAEVASGSAQGALRVSGAAQNSAFFHIEERPLGLQFLFIPAKADGTPDLGSSREYSFLKRGVRPTLSPDARKSYRDAPEGPVDIVAFVDGFRGWSPRDVARLYASLRADARGLILLHDHATAELMWRICEAGTLQEAEEAALSEMLERQQAGCASYLPLVEAAREGGLFPEFLRRAQFQFELIRATVLCDRGESAPARCADVSALAAPLVLRWRQAHSIMRALARPASGAAGGQVEMVPIPDPAQQSEAVPEDAAEEATVIEEEQARSGEPGTPLPLARPDAASEAVSDFLPDTSSLETSAPADETMHQHRLPLAPPE